ncbi:YchJ family protein [Streptomyces zhihengii]
MRSRYSAFVARDAAYLLRTWHSSTRPPHLELDEAMRWSGLEITDTTDGSAFHPRGTVTFRARYRHHGQRGELHERSEFAREGGGGCTSTGSSCEGCPPGLGRAPRAGGRAHPAARGCPQSPDGLGFPPAPGHLSGCAAP